MFWILFGIGCVYYNASSVIRCFRNADLNGYTADRIELIRRARLFGEGTSGLMYDGTDPFCVFVEKFGAAGLLVITALFGMAVTCSIGVHFSSLVVLSAFTNLCYISVIVEPPFLTQESLNVNLHI